MPAPRSEETRRRLLEAGAAVFAQHGFHRAPTRTIAKEAGANIALIHYHFGDKAGLYREIFAERFRRQESNVEKLIQPDAKFVEIYAGLARHLLTASDDLRRMARREEIEPTGLLGREWLQPLRKGHERFLASVCRELGLNQPDLQAERLAFGLVGMITVFSHNRPVIQLIAPSLVEDSNWIEVTIEQLTRQALALLRAERKARAGHRKTPR
ncbi:DUF1956 domain-containing protein [Opitutaceae bacterium]